MRNEAGKDKFVLVCELFTKGRSSEQVSFPKSTAARKTFRPTTKKKVNPDEDKQAPLDE